jgi:RNA polymerase sigma-70 factor (ECF subfamily)
MTGSGVLSLEDLMAAMQKGDRTAAHDLLKAAWVIAGIQVRRFLGASGIFDAALVEDIVQDALVAVYEKRNTYDPSHPFIPWLTAIARYKTIDRLRRSKRRRTEALDDLPAEPEAKTVPPEVAVDLERLLSQLPERARRAVELVKIQGLTHAQAGAELGLGESALKVLVHRTLKRLRGDAWSEGDG